MRVSPFASVPICLLPISKLVGFRSSPSQIHPPVNQDISLPRSERIVTPDNHGPENWRTDSDWIHTRGPQTRTPHVGAVPVRLSVPPFSIWSSSEIALSRTTSVQSTYLRAESCKTVVEPPYPRSWATAYYRTLPNTVKSFAQSRENIEIFFRFAQHARCPDCAFFLGNKSPFARAPSIGEQPVAPQRPRHKSN
jgi:hypothetical protein